jgi:hypothetical protein
VLFAGRPQTVTTPAGSVFDPKVRSCPIRARSKGQTRTLVVTHGTDTMVMTCIGAGLTRCSRSLPSWLCAKARMWLTAWINRIPILYEPVTSTALGLG